MAEIMDPAREESLTYLFLWMFREAGRNVLPHNPHLASTNNI
jgi:hypothetical protein